MDDAVILVDDTKNCPFCGETIKQVAIKCRFCGQLIGDAACPGVFREGKQLVLNQHAALPERCVKSNAPAERWLRRKVSWHSPLIYLLLLGGALPYIIGALISRKQATVNIPLSQAQYRSRRRKILVAWLISLSGVALFVTGIMKVNSRNDQLVTCLLMAGISSVFIGIVFGIVVSNPLKTKKIVDGYIWFGGSNPDFLDALPEWPGNL